MRIKGKIAKGILAALILTLIPVGAYSAQKITPGSACKVYKQKLTYLNKTFTCIKVKKKLVWDKGVAIKQATPTPTQSATPTPTPTPTHSATPTPTPTKSPEPIVVPIPITLPVAPGVITFSNILENVDKVAQVAYDNVQKTYSGNSLPTGLKTFIWVGPTTVPVGNMSEEERIVKAMKLWSGFNQPKSIGIFFFNTQDEPLAEIAYDKWRTDNKITTGQPASMMRNDCLSNNGPGAPVASTEPLKDCTGANAGVIDSLGTGVGWFGVPTEAGPRSDPYRLGALEIHEFTHMVQTAQFVGTAQQPGGALQAKSPCWLQEGQAHFASKTTASNTFSDYLRQRNGEALYRTNSSNVPAPRDLAGISEYLSLATLATCQSTYSWGYATGMLAVEALSAIGGVQSTMALYALEATGKSFSESFEMVYGISWDKAQPILAQVIARDYLVPSMNTP